MKVRLFFALLAFAIFGLRRRDREFVVLDDLLADAARQEGFKVVVPRAR